MPIGFWAISRNELREMITEKADGCSPCNWFLDKACQETQIRLNKVLDDVVEYYSQQIIDETDRLQKS